MGQSHGQHMKQPGQLHRRACHVMCAGHSYSLHVGDLIKTELLQTNLETVQDMFRQAQGACSRFEILTRPQSRCQQLPPGVCCEHPRPAAQSAGITNAAVQCPDVTPATPTPGYPARTGHRLLAYERLRASQHPPLNTCTSPQTHAGKDPLDAQPNSHLALLAAFIAAILHTPAHMYPSDVVQPPICAG